MKITAPIKAVSEIVPLAEAGADELYCGVLETRAVTSYLPNGRRHVHANLGGFGELAAAVPLAASRNVGLMFCANSPQGRGAMARYKRDIAKAYGAGIRKIVVSDFTFVPWLKAEFRGLYVGLSTRSPAFNSDAMELYAGMGVNRLILDRLHGLDEAEPLAARAKELGLDLEIFTTPMTCRHVDADCYLHTWLAPCMPPDGPPGETIRPLPCHKFHGEFSLSVRVKNGARWAARGPSAPYLPRGFKERQCSVCALWRLRKWGVPFLKIVGRGDPLKDKVLHVGLARSFIKGMENGTITAENFAARGRAAYRAFFGRGCGAGRCYYYGTGPDAGARQAGGRPR